MIISKELEDSLSLVIKHALFGNKDSFNLILNSFPNDIKDYLLLNLTRFANNLVDLVSRIKINTNGHALLIKDIEETDDPLKQIKIVNDTIFLKSNHLVNY